MSVRFNKVKLDGRIIHYEDLQVQEWSASANELKRPNATLTCRSPGRSR